MKNECKNMHENVDKTYPRVCSSKIKQIRNNICMSLPVRKSIQRKMSKMTYTNR